MVALGRHKACPYREKGRGVAMSFGEVIGQERAVAMLRRALENDRVAHAYIFHGPEGVGKKLTALTLAMALNCTAAGERPCGSCSVCSRVGRGIHPDVALVEPDGANIRIEQVREIERKLSMGAYEGRKRLYILDPADVLSLEAANAFLKTLEEPPLDTVFALITDKINRLLPTIISRCQLIPFSALRREDAARIVAARRGIEEGKALLAASFARGRLGAALAMDVDAFMELREEVLEKWFRLSREDGRKLLEMATSLTAHVREAGKRGIQPLDILITWFRDLALIKSGADPARAGLVHQDMIKALEAESERYTPGELNECFQAVHESLSILNNTNANKELAVTAMLVKMVGTRRMQIRN